MLYDLIINGPEEPVEKKNGTWTKGAGTVFPKTL